ncbi:MAG TPA: DUF3572 domain-containing protein [Rhabdaerophilum sp.]|nr:DUF3572 domain-containing protein [Rhabdaerophilum sp.]
MLRTESPADPEALAIAVLGFLAEDSERLNRFLTLTGIDPSQIRLAAREAGFLTSVLDHLLADEALLLAFSANARVRPETIAAARRKLDPRD